jgi:subtilase family serine protease
MRLSLRLTPAASLIAPAILAASLATSATAFAAPTIAALSAGQARFAVALPLRNRPQLDALLARLQDPGSPQYHKWLTSAQFASEFGPTSAAKLAVANELRAAGFTVDVASQDVFAHGSMAAAERYFGTSFALRTPQTATRPMLTPVGARRVSPLLASLQARVIGLDGLPDFHSNAVFGQDRSLRPLNLYSGIGPYLAPDLKQAYSYPSFAVANGAGTTIGIISSSPVAQSDINGYFNAAGEPIPAVFEYPIDGGGPYDASGGATGEATLDVEMSGGSAPDAHIHVYNVPDLSDGNLLEGYAVAVESDVDIISTSIGGCEKAYDNQTGIWFLEALDNVFAEGSAEGITLVGASGDNGAFECGVGEGGQNLSVQTPTDDPIMVGVGGSTTLTTAYTKGSDNSAYVSESSYDSPFTQHGGSVWGSCGGHSVIFALPSYQKGFVGGSFRGVPDLGMHMGGPATGNSLDYIAVGGQFEEVSGTSAAAPEFAGLLALRVQLHGRIGDPHVFLYSIAHTMGSYRSGIPGYNGYFKSTTTLWDPVMGLGSPYGRVVAGVPTSALAGIPGTSTNP